jgi:Mrp family chromosome partitioning ATPase
MPIKISFFGLNIDFLTAGSNSDSFNFIDSMNSQRIKELLLILSSHYDIVLLDTSPVLSMGGTAQISALCSGTVIVMQSDRHNQFDINQVINNLKETRILGIVKNEFPSTSPLSMHSENNEADRLFREFQSMLKPKNVKY